MQWIKFLASQLNAVILHSEIKGDGDSVRIAAFNNELNLTSNNYNTAANIAIEVSPDGEQRRNLSTGEFYL